MNAKKIFMAQNVKKNIMIVRLKAVDQMDNVIKILDVYVKKIIGEIFVKILISINASRRDV